MKKILLAILVVALAVSCFAMVATASAATTEISASETLSGRGYFKHGSDYFNIDLEQGYEDAVITTNPIEFGQWYVDNGLTATKAINGTNMYALTVPATSASKDFRGNLKGSNLLSQDKMTYIQFDVYTTADKVDIFTLKYWLEMHLADGAWSIQGFQSDFKSELIAENTHRLSFFVDFSQYNKSADYEIDTSASGEHVIAFDNFIVASIDTVRAPWVSSETVTYGIDAPHDVLVNLDAKGKSITSVTVGGEEVTAANYSYNDATETLTIAAAAFDGKHGDLACAATTDGGSVDFEVKQEQEKTALTAALVSNAPINKYVDGTTDVKEEIALTLSGYAEGHDVRVTYTAAYDSAAAGTGRKIILTLDLSGNDAYLYKLANSALEITDCEIYDYITVTPSYTGAPIVKYADGTTTVDEKITLTLTGILANDVIDVTFDAAYATAAAGATTITISNITLTGKDAAKYTLSVTSLQIDGEIIERTATTASYAGVIEKYYDGTTYFNLKDFKIALSDIDEHDEVSVAYKAVFASKEVGQTTVNFTNLALTGKDAYKYNLTNDSFAVDGYILEMKDVAISDGKGYFTLDGQTLQSINFDDVATGQLSAASVSGLYIESNPSVTQNSSMVAYGDNHVMKIETNCFAWTTQLFATNETSKYRDAGIYAVSFKVKPVDSSIIEAIVRNTDANNVTGILADFRLSITRDASGKATAVAKEFGGWTGTNQKYFNESYEVDADGWISCYFEFEVPEGTNFDNQYKPNVTFLGASPVSEQLSTYYFDDIKYICKSVANKYMTIDHNYDFDGENGAVLTDSIFYTDLKDGFVYDNEWIENETVLRLDIPSGASGQIGALRNGIIDGDYKLFKGNGIHYVQFDFDMVDCNSFKIYSHGEPNRFNYFAITFTKSGEYCIVSLECYDGWISNLTTHNLANGMTRVSFVADMTGSPYDATYMNLEGNTGSLVGSVFFGNFIVAHEDYTPIIENTTYNLVGNDDVELNVDLKGARLTGVQLDGVTVDENLYAYDSNECIILLDNSLFAGKTADVAIKVLTSAGDLSATAALYDNRKEITLTLDYTGEPIVKDYDGTTDVAEAIKDAIAEQIEMHGLNDGDDVTLTYDIAYSSKNAGAVTVQITNIALDGAQAENYKLGTAALSVDAAINKLQLTVSGTTYDGKVYDGTTNASVTVGTLCGVLEGENVTLTVASATFNSKNVADANKVTVVYALQGEDAVNYLAPETHDITNVTISRKAITVTAEAKTMTLGGTEPALTYTASGLVQGDTLSGALTREEGVEVGDYDILIGTLGNDNYLITYVAAKLSITEPTEPTEPKTLSAGAIAGICVGCVAVVAGAALAVVFILKKKRLSK